MNEALQLERIARLRREASLWASYRFCGTDRLLFPRVVYSRLAEAERIERRLNTSSAKP